MVDFGVLLGHIGDFHSLATNQLLTTPYLLTHSTHSLHSLTHQSGKWNDQTKDIENRAELEAPGTTLKYRPRSEEPHTSWRYGHPRTFKVHLIEHMTVADFTDAEGDWLLKATDRGFVYRMLELSGVKRVGYIKEEIYKYKFSVKGSTLATVPIEVRQANLQHVLGMEPSDALLLPVHVVFVLWDRLMLLPEQLENLWVSVGPTSFIFQPQKKSPKLLILSRHYPYIETSRVASF